MSNSLKLHAAIFTVVGALAIAPAMPTHAAGPDKDGLEIRRIHPLQWGEFASGQSEGTIRIEPQTGARSLTGGVTPIGFGDTRRAEYEVLWKDCRPGAKFAIMLPPQAQLSGSSNTEIVSLESFPKDTGEIGENCRATIYVGGTMKVPARAKSAKNSGVFEVTVKALQ